MTHESRLRKFLDLLYKHHSNIFTEDEYDDLAIIHDDMLTFANGDLSDTLKYERLLGVTNFFNGLNQETLKTVKKIQTHDGSGEYIISIAEARMNVYYNLSLNETV